MLRIYVIQILYEGLESLVVLIAEQEPFQRFILAPFNELRYLVPHEVELLARVSHLIDRQKSDSGELSPYVSRHAAYKALFTVHHFIVRERQYVVFAVGICHGERQLIMVFFSPWEVRRHIIKRIVHPAHVPLVVEAQAAVLRRFGHKRPCRALFRDSDRSLYVVPYHVVELLQEFDRVQIAFSAVSVKAHLRLVADAEVQIQHAGYAIDSETVGVVFLEPVHRIRKQEAPYLRSAEVELICTPVRMYYTFVEFASIEVSKALVVRAEVSRYPVQYDSYACFMERLYEVLEVM